VDGEKKAEGRQERGQRCGKASGVQGGIGTSQFTSVKIKVSHGSVSAFCIIIL
jgi:hypothetical protein